MDLTITFSISIQTPPSPFHLKTLLSPSSPLLSIIYALAAALQASSWVLQSATVVPGRDPELAASAQALFWIEQERWRAAAAFTKVSPLTENGRSPVLSTTAGAAPPRVPVKVWMFEEVAAVAAELVAGAA